MWPDNLCRRLKNASEKGVAWDELIDLFKKSEKYTKKYGSHIQKMILKIKNRPVQRAKLPPFKINKKVSDTQIRLRSGARKLARELYQESQEEKLHTKQNDN